MGCALSTARTSPQQGGFMFRQMLKNRMYRKIVVFAFAFAAVGTLVILQAACPEAGPAARMVLLPSRSMITMSGAPAPAPLTDNDLALQLAELDIPLSTIQSMVATKSKGPYVNAPFSVMDITLSEELQRYTYNRCQELGLEYEMVLAIMWRESRFQPSAVGVNRNGTRDSGLMQINDVNKKWLLEKHGIEDLLDPYQNIDAGTAILAKYFSKYSENYALMAYQYGEQGMLERAKQGIETNDLTIKVQKKRDEYKQIRLGQ